MSIGDNAPEIGPDALDAGGAPTWTELFPARGAALGLRPSAAPSLVFVTAGVILGPAGVDLLNTNVLARLDVVVSVALAALGVFVGLGVGAIRGPARVPLFAAALLQAALTIAMVTGGMYVLVARWAMPVPLELGLFVTALGVCSCASAATRPAGETRRGRIAAAIGDLDDLPLIVLGTLLVAAASGRPVTGTILITAVASLLTGAAGWLLFERADSDAQRGVFVAGTVLLLGGIAAYSGTSPLLSGCVAALFWHRAAGAADRIIADDIGKLQHPLVGLLLVVAGASIEWTPALAWIAGPLVLLRMLGKLVGSAAAARVVTVPAGFLTTVLLPPGVLGIALALNLYQVLGAAGSLLLSGVTVAAVVSELAAALVPVDAEITR